ncbi:energy transducer TonB, partial [bacterium]|nr:energy transducer TonB [bacterium]
ARDIKVIQKLGYGCDEAAINALKASKFSPAKRDKTPVAVRIQIPYRFEFED